MISRCASLQRPARHFRYLSTNAALSEYTDEPQYPEILDLTFEARRYRKKEVLTRKIQALSTVEEKVMALNMKKYYGFKCILLNDKQLPYNSLPFIQYCTRTKCNEGDQLPEYYAKFDEPVQRLLPNIKGRLEEAMYFELECHKQAWDLKGEDLTERHKVDILSSAIVNQVHRIVLDSLLDECEHLRAIDVDVDPVHEAFWFVGGIEPLTIVQKIRDGVEWQKKHKMDPVDRPFQYTGNPHLAVRHNLPLAPVAPVLKVNSGEIPTFKLDPRTLGYNTAYRHGSVAPGIWPGNKMEFGLLSYQRRTGFFKRNPSIEAEDTQATLHGNGILGLYGWLLGQAYHQGFTTYNELTYPLSGQSITTDGQFWSFHVYQLNTVLTHTDFVEAEGTANEYWGTKDAKLFEEIDEQGKLVGFDEQVVGNLLRMYLNAPKERAGVDLQPYLNPEERYASEVKDNEKRLWLDQHYKNLVRNKPRHRLGYEIYQWEKFYMVDHNTRPMMARRRPFQRGVNPYDRQLNDHTPKYIPKPLRPEGPKSKKKFEKVYYPEVYKD